jgi:Protein-tyrosine-phosphatase
MSEEESTGSSETDVTDNMRVAFVCVQNAGRSQMATAFAKRERAQRGLQESIDIVTGGTDPADTVHEVVVDAMDELGVDLTGQSPREVDSEELDSCDYVATMGCSTLELGVIETTVDVREWDLDDPHGEEIGTVREIREEIKQRVKHLFEEAILPR